MSTKTKEVTLSSHLKSSEPEVQLHNYLDKILLFPENLQDKIIEEISMLHFCTETAIHKILMDYIEVENTELDKTQAK